MISDSKRRIRRQIMTKIIDFLKEYTDGKHNTEKVEISVLQLNRVIKALESEPAP
jgi:hemerythrin-like domain-containing protein